MKDFRVFSKKIYFILVFILVTLSILDYGIFSNLKAPKVLENSTQTISEYPILRITQDPQISAEGVVVMDADSKVVLYEKNPNLKFSSASTTKIMTAITALDYFHPNDVLTVKNAITDGVVLGLKTGQKITFDNLLYALLLPSANDMAFVIAQNYGPEGGFVRKMNQNASKFNLYNTHYEDPAGLEDDGDYTTPFDLARLASIAIENEKFAEIVSTKEKTITDLEGNSYPLKNLNKLLGIDGVDGIKTGFTQGAGQVLVTSKKEGTHTIIVVVMGSADRFFDTEKLLSMISGNVTYLSIHP